MVLTTILIICIASNPELAPFVPVLDAFGLDVLLYLFAVQLGVVVGDVLPFARYAYRRGVRLLFDGLRALLAFSIGSYLRQLLWHMKQAGVAVAVFGPNQA